MRGNQSLSQRYLAFMRIEAYKSERDSDHLPTLISVKYGSLFTGSRVQNIG